MKRLNRSLRPLRRVGSYPSRSTRSTLCGKLAAAIQLTHRSSFSSRIVRNLKAAKRAGKQLGS